MNPVYPEAFEKIEHGRPAARLRDLPRALRALRLPARGARRPVPRRARLDRAPVRGHRRPALPRPRRCGARGGAALGRHRASSARPAGTRRSRPRDAARARGHARRPRHRPPLTGELELDIEQRPKKSPRAFCAPIEVPGRVVLVIQPIGGADDWRALFHEAGHTEHFAHVADLPVEAKRLGDDSVTEGWATLMEHLLLEPAWLSRRLDFPKPDEFAAEAATGSSTSCAATAGSSSTSSSSTAPPSDPKAMSCAVRRDPGRGAEDRAEPDRRARRHRLELLRHGVPPLVGAPVAAARALSRAVRLRVVRRPQGGRDAPRALVRRTPPERRRAAGDVTGEELEMESFAQSLREQLR